MYEETTKKIEQRQRIGQQFKTEREAQGWSTEQVATMAGVTQRNVEKIEAGIYNVPFDVLARVAEVLGCEVGLKQVEL
jgi:transcriptional regulator with XRE-family HTH domain